jgi:uncharacterized protein (DUF2252 family)
MTAKASKTKTKAKAPAKFPQPRPVREKREAAGKALRKKCGRKNHAAWKAPANRRDPIEILIESSDGRIPRLLPIRYGRMMQSPFAFYRGAAAIMAADLANTPTSGIRVQACGDCHLMNFGAFGTRERRIIFDINDFDETLPAPWEWDVKRLVASFVIAGRNNRFRKSECADAARQCAQSYREHMQGYSKLGALEMWYQRIDDLIALVERKDWKKTVQKQIDKAMSRSVAEDEFPKLASLTRGKARIKDNPPLIFHDRELGPKEYDRHAREAFKNYRETLPDDVRTLVTHYELKDIAIKVVGVGSVGTRCGILLMMAQDGEPLFLQVKEARASVLEPYAGKSVYENSGERVVAGQRLMQSASDMFLGWTEMDGRQFYIRQLRDIKIKPMVETFDARGLTRYAFLCGWALARAHAKAGDAAMISGYLGSTGRFDDAIVDFAAAYADQNERDHQALLKAIRAGKIKVYRE